MSCQIYETVCFGVSLARPKIHGFCYYIYIYIYIYSRAARVVIVTMMAKLAAMGSQGPLVNTVITLLLLSFLLLLVVVVVGLILLQ